MLAKNCLTIVHKRGSEYLTVALSNLDKLQDFCDVIIRNESKIGNIFIYVLFKKTCFTNNVINASLFADNFYELPKCCFPGSARIHLRRCGQFYCEYMEHLFTIKTV